jgi:signal transduction histidine kinase
VDRKRLTRTLRGDATLAVVLAVAGAFWTAGADLRTDADVPIDGLGYVLVVATALALAVRRRWPLVTLALATAMTSAYLVIGYPYGPILVSFLVAVYTTARHRPLRTSVPASIAALGVLLIHLFTSEAALPGFLGVIPGSAWVVVPFSIGVSVRLVQESAARARAEAVRERVDQERLRVAQEVHDIVGHGLAAINMQANVALHLLAKQPEQGEVALKAISRSSAEALEELRATLSTVRRDKADTARAPTPGLEGVEDLCERIRKAGVRIRVERTGTRRTLPSAVDRAGYRIVQESLTNVLRHGDPKVATVRIRYEDEAVALSISNPVRDVRDAADGLGIAGMRERVSMLGGDFTAGLTSDRRFEVRARLPTGGSE